MFINQAFLKFFFFLKTGKISQEKNKNKIKITALPSTQQDHD
jgi:hypothetical protein